MTDPRHNPDLEAAFASPPPPPPKPADDIRHNPALDEAFGAAPAAPKPDTLGPVVQALAASVEKARAAGVEAPADQAKAAAAGPADGWGEVLAKLGDAAERLTAAADKMTGGPTATEPVDDGIPIRSPRAPDPTEQWASGVLGRAGGQLAGGIGRWLGPEAGRAAGGGLQSAIGGLFSGGGGAAAAGGAEAAAAGGAAGGLGGAAGGAMAAAGPVGVGVAAVVAAAGALKQLHDTTIETAKAQQQANFVLAEYSAAMAGVQATADVNKTFREAELGDRTAGSAERLQESLDRYEDAMVDVREFMSKFWNFVSTIGLDLISTVFEFAAPFFKWLIENLDAIARFFKASAPKEDDGDLKGFGDLLDFAAKEEEQARGRNGWAFDAFDRDRRYGTT